MNSRRLSAFLESMEKSCDVYSGSALEERKRMQEVDRKFRELDKSVHRTLNVVPRKNQEIERVPTRNCKTRSASRTKAEEVKPKMVVRPAPYPVKNYILPAQQLVGPRKYFRSRAQQRIKDEERDTLNEYAKYPNSFERSPEKPIPDLMITPAKSLHTGGDSERSWIDVEF